LNQVVGTGPKCLKPAQLIIKGMSMGIERFEGWNGKFIVCNKKEGCANEEATPFMGNEEETKAFDLPLQTHSEITVISPVGAGKSNSFQLKVAGQPSNNITLYYKPPIVTSTKLNPYDSRGPDSYVPEGSIGPILELRGQEFGGKSSEVRLTIGGKVCNNAIWHPYHIQDGFPYISCAPQADVVGKKNATLTVANQQITIGISNLNAMFASICHPGPQDLDGKTELYWGSENELCVKCPQPGAICKPSSLDDPLSQLGFWRMELDLTCTEEGRDTSSPYECKEYNNIKRSKRAIDENRCSTNRTNHGLKNFYPNLQLRDYCYDFAACQPKEACTGNNTCREEYQWTLNQCILWEKGEKLRGMPLKNGKVQYGLGEGNYPCETDIDCRTRSGNKNTPNGGDNINSRPMDGAFCAKIKGANGNKRHTKILFLICVLIFFLTHSKFYFFIFNYSPQNFIPHPRRTVIRTVIKNDCSF
jgi:hypothetical protein